MAHARPLRLSTPVRHGSPACPIINLLSDSDSDTSGDESSTGRQPSVIDLTV